MSRLPVCSGADAVKAFRRLGYEVDHQTGSRHFGSWAIEFAALNGRSFWPIKPA
jgi:hypothetical protein